MAIAAVGNDAVGMLARTTDLAAHLGHPLNERDQLS
jgi:hypothetical protein